MQSRRQLLAEAALVVATALVGVATVDQLPAEMAIHFGPGGRPDEFVARPLALALVPAIQTLVLGLFALLPRLDPLGENVRALGRAYDAFVLLLLGFLGYVHVLVVLWNFGYAFSMSQALAPALAVFYYALGLLVERAEPNWFVGFRTPWTLSDEEVWADTHALAGKLLLVAAVLSLCALVLPAYALLFLVGPVLVVAVVATAYSYWDYRQVTATA